MNNSIIQISIITFFFLFFKTEFWIFLFTTDDNHTCVVVYSTVHETNLKREHFENIMQTQSSRKTLEPTCTRRSFSVNFDSETWRMALYLTTHKSFLPEVLNINKTKRTKCDTKLKANLCKNTIKLKYFLHKLSFYTSKLHNQL